MKKPTITKEGLMLWLKQIQTMSLETKEHKQRLIDCFVNAVYLYDDKLVITFNYKEASKTVTLKEVNGSIIECSGAPIKAMENDTFSVAFILCWKRTRTHLNATRMSVARCGWTQRNLYFAQQGQKCKSSPATGTMKRVIPVGITRFIFVRGRCKRGRKKARRSNK